MTHLLSRYAEAAFWMGRYVERAESLARVIDVADTFSRSSRGVTDWNAVLALYADEDAYRQRHGEVSGQKVVHFYLLDRGNPGSVISAIQAARENARALRPMISSEIWEQLNTFNNWIRALDPEDLTRPGLYRLCRRIKELCQTHAGVVEATMFRDESWYFYHIGKLIERGAQTAHYLDVRYHMLDARRDDDDGESFTQWTALLRSQAALHGYRQRHPQGVSPRGVVAFLLLDRRFPRSVANCTQELTEWLTELRERFQITVGETSADVAAGIAQEFRDLDIAAVVDTGLHEMLDRTQLELYALSDALHRDFFGRAS